MCPVREKIVTLALMKTQNKTKKLELLGCSLNQAKHLILGVRYSLGLESVFSICKALGSIPSTKMSSKNK
jgi:hypothetical protein